MNYLIFGGEGFIGTHLKNHIINSNTDPVVYSLDIANNKKTDQVNYINTDVRKSICLPIPNVSSSVIYNLAAVHKSPGHQDNEYFETNIPGAENVCNFARNNNINTIVFTSSIAPYGASEELKHEASLPMPNTPYGISKLTAEHIHRLWQAEEPGIRKLIIVRPGVVFGKGEGGNFTRLYQSMSKGFFFYPGRKDTVKAAVYVKDVARILYDSSIHSAPGVCLHNLSFFPAHTIESICRTISEITGVKPPKLLIPGKLLVLVAAGGYYSGRLFGKKNRGIHPDRVRKLMISTNISGEKLAKSCFALKYTLQDAIEDWFIDCNRKGLF